MLSEAAWTRPLAVLTWSTASVETEPTFSSRAFVKIAVWRTSSEDAPIFTV